MSFWTLAWIFWLLFFAAIEGAALLRKGPDDTLSEHVWKWFQIRNKPRAWTWRRAVLAAFLVWLLVHMVAGF
jgi:hypothetical protein